MAEYVYLDVPAHFRFQELRFSPEAKTNTARFSSKRLGIHYYFLYKEDSL